MAQITATSGSLTAFDTDSKVETLDFTIRIGSTPTFLHFDLYLNTAYAAHYVYSLYYSIDLAFQAKIFFKEEFNELCHLSSFEYESRHQI